MNEPSDPKEIADSSVWKKLAETLKQGAIMAGKGLSYAYGTAHDNAHLLLPVLNGVIGDTLAKKQPAYAIQMSFRSHGEDVSVEELNLHVRLQGVGQHIIVFVHGLMCDENIWQSHKTHEIKEIGYGTLIKQELGATVLYVRYNSGLHVSENGQAFSELLEQLVTFYGDSIKDITLISYSMGGLVVRSAGYYADKQQKSWLNKLTSVVLIGVPNDGSYLEQVGHLTSSILKNIWNLPTRLVANALDQRSNGIKDLRWGFMVDEDWQHENAEGLLGVKRTIVKPLPGVAYHIIVGIIAEDSASPVAWYFGDGLVGKGSAMGQHFREEHITEMITCKTFTNSHHGTILNNQAVYDYLKYILEFMREK